MGGADFHNVIKNEGIYMKISYETGEAQTRESLRHGEGKGIPES